MLLIVLITPPIAALTVSPCLIVTIKVSLKFGALRKKILYLKNIASDLKILKEEYNIVRE